MKIQIDTSIINSDWFRRSNYLSVYIYSAMTSGPVRVVDISIATGVSKQQVCRILDHLVKGDYIQKNRVGTRLSLALFGKKDKTIPVTRKITEGFDNWWSAYPSHRRSAKQECKRVWSKIISNGSSPKLLIDALVSHKQSDQWSNPNFVCSSLKFLKEERYLLDIDPSNKKENKYVLSVN